MINKARLVKLTQQLIRIDSRNPGADESQLASFVKEYLLKLGLEVKIYEFKKRRANIVAYLKGRSAKNTLLITPHLDTVPAGENWKYPPLSAKVQGGRIYGLGATDCKCNLAVSLEVVRSLVEEGVGLDYNLCLAATADEETGSALGVIPLLKKGILNPDAAAVLDADGFHVVVAQKGLMHLKLVIKGKRAHGAYPWLGVNAIDACVNILHDLKRVKARYKKNKYLRSPTINIGTIKGGDKVNVVADWCECELDFRFLPGQKSEEILSGLRRIVRRHARKFHIEIQSIQNYYLIEETHPLVTGFVSALKKYRISPKITGSEGATTITFFQDRGIPAVATGFGSIGCAHTVNEYVNIDDIYKGAFVLEEFLKNYKFNHKKS